MTGHPSLTMTIEQEAICDACERALDKVREEMRNKKHIWRFAPCPCQNSKKR